LPLKIVERFIEGDKQGQSKVPGDDMGTMGCQNYASACLLHGVAK